MSLVVAPDRTSTLERARGWVTYGWVNVIVAALAMGATFPGRTQGLGMITESLLADLSLSKDLYSDLNLWATLLGALFCLPVGGWIDRFGSRAVLTGLYLALGAAVAWMSTVQSVPALFLALVLTRGFGQSALSVVSITLVAKWFQKRQLGLAMACYSVLTAAAFMGAVKLMSVALLGLGLGWRNAWAAVGLTLALGLAPLSWLLARDTAAPAPAAAGEVLPPGPPEGATLGEALRTGAFWVFSAAVSFYGLTAAGIALYNEAIFRELGLATAVYHNSLLVAAPFGLASKFAAGWLAGRWSIGKLLALAMAVQAGALAALPLVGSPLGAYAYAAAMGVAGGVVALVFFAVWGQTFGRRQVGRIQGVAQMLTVLASAFGPKVFTGGWQYAESYLPVFQALAPAAAVLALLSWWVRLPGAGGAAAPPAAGPEGRDGAALAAPRVNV